MRYYGIGMVAMIYRGKKSDIADDGTGMVTILQIHPSHEVWLRCAALCSPTADFAVWHDGKMEEQ